LSKAIFSYASLIVKPNQPDPALLSMTKGITSAGEGMTEYPKRGLTASYIGLAVIGFILVMVLLFLYLRRSPAPKTQPDKSQSSGIYLLHEAAVS
jgi:hypothetical protein